MTMVATGPAAKQRSATTPRATPETTATRMSRPEVPAEAASASSARAAPFCPETGRRPPGRTGTAARGGRPRRGWASAGEGLRRVAAATGTAVVAAATPRSSTSPSMPLPSGSSSLGTSRSGTGSGVVACRPDGSPGDRSAAAASSSKPGSGGITRVSSDSKCHGWRTTSTLSLSSASAPTPGRSSESMDGSKASSWASQSACSSRQVGGAMACSSPLLVSSTAGT